VVRSTQELFADPTMPDADLLGCPIPDAAALAAVRARPHKSPALIADLVDGVIHNRYPTHPIDNDVVACVLAETALSTEDLAALARTVQVRPRFDTSLIAALIAHPRLDPRAAINVLLGTSRSVAQELARASGSLLPAAIWWVRSTSPNLFRASNDTAEAALCVQIMEVATRLAARSEANPALAFFLATSSFDFANEDEMFAAGHALCSPPKRS